MPELIEVEIYRRTATRTLGRCIEALEQVDAFGLRSGSDRSNPTTAEGLADALVGSTVLAARRVGKLLMLDLSNHASAAKGVVLGLRFGMTGRLVVDGKTEINELLYTSDRDDAEWDRFRVRFADGGTMAVRDPRRLGGVELDPDVGRLGPDATMVTRSQLRAVLADSGVAVKARIMDQGRIAGIGNLLADEILWRAGIAPMAAARSLSANRVTRLYVSIVSTVAELTDRGGSHLGDVMEARHPGGLCPRDGAAMRTTQVGGRTSWWCPKHQR